MTGHKKNLSLAARTNVLTSVLYLVGILFFFFFLFFKILSLHNPTDLRISVFFFFFSFFRGGGGVSLLCYCCAVTFFRLAL